MVQSNLAEGIEIVSTIAEENPNHKLGLEDISRTNITYHLTNLRFEMLFMTSC